MTTRDLFPTSHADTRRDEPLCDGAVVLRGFALAGGAALLQALDTIVARAPFRHMTTPGGFRMSVGMTNAGPLGWISDRRGYRYDPIDPMSGEPWPAMPPEFLRLAVAAATHAGFGDFVPDACLVNRYAPGTRLSLHQDRDEQDYRQPIVSVSLGIPATFCLVVCSDRIVHSVCRWHMATWWCGVARRDCAITEYCRLNPTSTMRWANAGSTSPSDTQVPLRECGDVTT